MSERRAGVISSRGICVPDSPTSLAVDSFPSRGSAPSLVFLLSLSAPPTPRRCSMEPIVSSFQKKKTMQQLQTSECFRLKEIVFILRDEPN